MHDIATQDWNKLISVLADQAAEIQTLKVLLLRHLAFNEQEFKDTYPAMQDMAFAEIQTRLPLK